MDSFLLNWFPAQNNLLILIAICAFAALESIAVIGLILPGAVMMTMVASWAGSEQVAVILTLISACVGAIIGDSLSYWLGQTQKQQIPRLWLLNRHPNWLLQGQSFFTRYGGLSVFFGRFVGPLRPLIPMIAGMMAMPWRKFFFANILSAIGWAPLYILPGYYLGQAWRENLHLSPNTTLWLIEFTFVILIVIFAFSWLRQLFDYPRIGYRGFLLWSRQSSWRRHWWLRSRQHFTHGELPLATLLLLVISVLGFILWTLLIIIHHFQPLPFDLRSQILFNQLNQMPLLYQLAVIGDKIADRWGIMVFVIPWLIFWVYRRNYLLLLHAIVALFAITILTTLVKIFIARPRPIVIEHLQHSFSYPSAHTAVIVVVCGFIATCVAQYLPQRWRNWPYWLATIVVIFIALSRLLYQVHWASDLIGGALLGLIVCALTRLSYVYFAQRPINWRSWPYPLLIALVALFVRVIFFN